MVFAKTRWDLFLSNLPLFAFLKFAIIFLQCFLQGWPSIPGPPWLLKDCQQSKGLLGTRICHLGSIPHVSASFLVTPGHQIPFPPLFSFIRGMALDPSLSCSCYMLPTEVFGLHRSLLPKFDISETKLTLLPLCSACPLHMSTCMNIPISHSQHVHAHFVFFPSRETILPHQHLQSEACALFLKWLSIEWLVSTHFKEQQTHLLPFSNFLKGQCSQALKQNKNQLNCSLLLHIFF